MAPIDVAADARRAHATLAAGGVALVPGDVGYAVMSSTAAGMATMFTTKRRAAHKRHAMLGNRDIERDVHVLGRRERAIVDVITGQLGLPMGVIAPYRDDHPLIRALDPSVLPSSTVNGTLSILVNGGPLIDALTERTAADDLPVMGSSANLTGTGTRFRLEDVQDEVVGIADLVVDYGLSRYHWYGRSSTLFDLTTMEVVRIGACYDVIADVLRRHFDLELPPDPGLDALPSGHLREPGAPTGGVR